jgi:sterol desaturase/sphingolipid hydroxylase (fatty acid hydroxylase superfamily)
MQSFVDFFEHMPSWLRATILAGGLVLFWIIEGLVPLVKLNYNKWQHASKNLFFTLTTIVVNFAFAFLLLWVANIVANNQIGLWHWFNFKLNWITVIAGLMLLDLVGAYLVHFVEHKVKFMWQFHVIHHTDQQVDATSANRHHPGESFFRVVFTAIAILVAGVPFGIVFLYQSLSAMLSQFNHSNIALPLWLDNVLSWILVTPRMHRVHHHYQQPLSDTNYGNIFSIWDRLFGTFAKVKKQEELVFGVDTYMNPKEHSIVNLLKLPFKEYRNNKNLNEQSNSKHPTSSSR